MKLKVKNILWWSPLILLYGVMPFSGDIEYIAIVFFVLKFMYVSFASFVLVIYKVIGVEVLKRSEVIGNGLLYMLSYAAAMFYISWNVYEYNYQCMKGELLRITDEIQVVCEQNGECPTDLTFIEGVSSKIVNREVDGGNGPVNIDVHVEKCIGDSDITYDVYNKTRFLGRFFPSYSNELDSVILFGGGVGNDSWVEDMK